MKITLNLATPPSRRERFGFYWSLPLALAAMLVFVLLARSVFREFLTYRSVEKSHETVAAEDRDLKSKVSALEAELRKPQYAHTLAKTDFINRMIATREVSILDLAERTGKLLPPDARLVALAIGSWNPEESAPSVRFSVESKDEKSAERFLSNLENSADFSDVVIGDEGLESGQNASGGASPRVMLVCTASYAPRESEAQQ